LIGEHDAVPSPTRPILDNEHGRLPGQAGQ
jgi:hypothetical protein